MPAPPQAFVMMKALPLSNDEGNEMKRGWAALRLNEGEPIGPGLTRLPHAGLFPSRATCAITTVPPQPVTARPVRLSP